MTIPVYYYTLESREEFREVYAMIRYRSMLGKFSHPFCNPVGTYIIQVSGTNKRSIAKELHEAHVHAKVASPDEYGISELMERVN